MKPSCLVADAGYVEATGIEQDGSTVPVLVEAGEGPSHRIELTKHPGAFLTFSELHQSDSSEPFIAFATDFGLLGHPRDDFHLIEVGDDHRETGTAEPLALWKEESAQLHFAVALWTELRRKRPRTDRLEAQIRWALRHLPIFRSTPLNEPVEALAETEDRLLGFDWAAGRLVPAGRRLLMATMKAKLDERNVRVGFAMDGEQVDLVLQPHTLLGALWTQFAGAVTGNKQHRLCEGGCGRWLPIGWDSGGYRTNRLTCSGACRVRAYRRAHPKPKAKRDARRL